MATRPRAPLFTLGWQSWTIVATVLSLVLLATCLLIFGVGSN